MPAISLAKLPTLPYVYSTTTPATINTCQIITLPNCTGLTLTLHNRDKASKNLRISYDPTLTQGGTAPAMYFTLDNDVQIALNKAALSGFTASNQLAVFSDSASVNVELMFTSTAGK
jgi:hypothetical protein